MRRRSTLLCCSKAPEALQQELCSLPCSVQLQEVQGKAGALICLLSLAATAICLIPHSSGSAGRKLKRPGLTGVSLHTHSSQLLQLPIAPLPHHSSEQRGGGSLKARETRSEVCGGFPQYLKSQWLRLELGENCPNLAASCHPSTLVSGEVMI